MMDNDKNCVVCDKNLFKYTCPKCNLKTCSLPCVNIHKQELKCDGKRDVTAYVPMSKFDNLNLLSDYRFLENVDRFVNNCRRNPQKRFTRYKQKLPPHLSRLKAAAAHRKTSLQFLPQHFTRHAENKTKLDYGSKEISWKIEFIFPQGDLLKISEVVNENIKLATIVSKYLDPVQCPNIYKQYLKFYHASGISDVYAMLKAERTGQPNGVFILDLHSDIKKNLSHKFIIENPVILIIKKSYKEEYMVLEDRVDECFDVEAGNKYGFFGDFTPIGYFDSLELKTDKRCPVEKAVESIHESASSLRFGDEHHVKRCNDNDDELDPSPCRPKLNIPSYDQLCSL